ncbi:ABC transporter substrate-binding protein [Paenibacillus sp. URB8-2]|uniref:ABC transporter substrate-binding protein n=1 Tax=Paenibacillus sp. URB8-2 TaxID=2741301 RepID=UPI0015C1D0A4|nr:putative ABC transporter extracellular-binding protein YurO [Paenibacillus sp. URB8-2]
MLISNLKKFMATASVSLLLVAGCSSPTGSSSNAPAENKEPAAAAAADNKQLSLLIPNFYNDTEKHQWESVVSKFKELNPGVEVTLSNGDVNTESGKLTTTLQSGVTPPDAILMNAGPGRVSILSDVGLIKPLNDWYAKNSWKDKLQPFAYQMAAVNDTIYELPHTVDAIEVYYNKDIFAKYSIPVPQTGDEFVAAMKKLKDNGVTPLNTAARTSFTVGGLFSNILESVAGRDAVEALLYGEKQWTDPEIVKAGEMLADWAKQGYIGKESMSLNLADLQLSFLDKKVAMMISPTHLISTIVDKKVEDSIGTFSMPSFISGEKTEPTGGLGYTWVVPTKAVHPGQAENWLNFIVSEDYANVVLSDPSYNLIPTSQAALNVKPAGALLAGAIQSIKARSGYNPSVFIGSEAKEAYYQNLVGLVGGLVKPQEAMGKIAEGVKKDQEAGYQLTR